MTQGPVDPTVPPSSPGSGVGARSNRTRWLVGCLVALLIIVTGVLVGAREWQ